jgi:hypothetical protein
MSKSPYADHHVETASVVGCGKAIEFHKFDNPERAAYEVCREVAATNVDTSGSKKLKIDWLPMAAEKYDISAKAEDFVAVPVIVMTSDLPNRNLVAFSKKRLIDFDTHTCQLAYQSMKGVPCHENHVNSDVSRAKGVVLDVGLRRVEKAEGGLLKVIALAAIDRRKDPILANGVLSGQNPEYSMGALVRGYTCSICGVEAPKPAEPKCNHIPGNRRTMNVFRKDGREHLAYWNAGPFKFFELSCLTNQPAAFVSARTKREDVIDLSS